jgi:hypothetical protein
MSLIDIVKAKVLETLTEGYVPKKHGPDWIHHPDHAKWKAEQKAKTVRTRVVHSKPIDTSDHKLHKALENHLGGSFEHFESEPKHGHNEHGHPTMIARVTHSYTHEDLGMHPDEMDDTSESYRVKVTKHPQHGYQVGHLSNGGLHEEVDLNEAFTVTGVKGSESGDRWEMRTHAKGEKHEWSSIVKTHQNGKSIKNEHGGYSPYKTGKTSYVKSHFAKLREEVELEEEFKKGSLVTTVKGMKGVVMNTRETKDGTTVYEVHPHGDHKGKWGSDYVGWHHPDDLTLREEVEDLSEMDLGPSALKNHQANWKKSIKPTAHPNAMKAYAAAAKAVRTPGDLHDFHNTIKADGNHIEEATEHLEEKQFGAPASKEKFKFKSNKLTDVVSSMLKKKLDNKTPKPVKEEVELEEAFSVVCRGNTYNYRSLKDALNDGHPHSAVVHSGKKQLGTVGSLKEDTLQEITKARVIAAIRKGIDKEKDAWKSGDMTNAVRMGKKVVSVASKVKSHFKEETKE